MKFLGSLDDKSPINEFCSATVFVLPCVKAKNGDLDVCPLTLQEVMLARILVVSSDIASIPELIEDQREGFLVEPGNVENINLRIRMGRNGLKKN